MSAYGHQMERESSARSISSAASSEVGSHYTMETGIYMSSFAATVLIAGLVTVGISLLTLLIALTVMLQSCQISNAGIVEMPESIYNYDYCKIVAMHTELNGINADSTIPVICKDVEIQYIREGRYLKDLNTSVTIAENYLNSVRPLSDGLDVVLIDVDDVLVSNFSYPYPILHRFDHNFTCRGCLGNAKYLKQMFVRNLYQKLRAGGWRLILLSRRPEKLRNAIEEYLVSAGCDGWSSLIMRTNDELLLSTPDYFSRQRMKLQIEGFRIIAVISSKMDALRGSSLGTHIFKLPYVNFYDNIEHHYEVQTD